MNKRQFSALTYKYKDYRQEIERYLLLILIPLAFCVVLYFGVQQVVNSQIEENAADTVSQVYLRTAAMMHEVDMVNTAIFMDVASLNNTSGDNSTPYQLNDPSSICRQLEIRRGSSNYIKHIYLISEEWQRILSDIGYYNYNSLDSILTLVGTEKVYFESIDELTWNMQTTSHLTDPFCVIPYRDSDGNIVGRVLITLDLTIFMETLSDLNTRFVCLYNEDSFITSQLLSEDIADIDWDNERAVSDALGMPVKCFYVHVDDYTYMAAIDRSGYYQPFRVIAFSFAVYALLVFLLGFLYLSKVSKERYRQLSALIAALPQSSEDAPVSYRELLPKVQEVLLTLRDKEDAGQPTAGERILRNILYADKPVELSENLLEKIGITDSKTQCYVAVFYIRSFDTVALVSSHTDDVNEMSWVIFQSSLEQFSEQEMKHTSCMDSGSFTAVFYESNCGDFGAHVTKICESVCQFMAESYGIRMQVAVSGSVLPGELGQAFRQAQSLEKFAVAIDSDSYIISQDSFHDGDGSLLMDGNFIRQQQLLLNTLLMEKYDLIPSMVHSILRQHVRAQASDYALAASRLRSVSSILAETLLSTSPAGVDIAACMARLEAVDSISELNDAVGDIYTPLAQSMTEGIRTYKEVDNARQYIRDNLSNQNLNVSAICEAVGIIAQRLTPMFQTQLNMGIAEYVNYCRIEQAKELLTSSKLTVKKIGEEVGYSTTDTFTRNFRKLENLTPTEYRKIVS